MIFNRIFIATAVVVIVASLSGQSTAQSRLQSSDLLKLRSVCEVKFSPDGSRLAYTVINNDGSGRPYSQLWITNLSDGKPIKLAVGKESSSNPEWSPDGQWIA
jgi:Tol biopolymer transport system component